MRIFGFVVVLCLANSAVAQELAPPPVQSPEQAHRAQVFQQVRSKQARILRKAAAKVKSAYTSTVNSVPLGTLLAKPTCASLESNFQALFKGCKFTFQIPQMRAAARAVVTLETDLLVDIKTDQEVPGKKHSKKNNGTSVQFTIETGVISVATGSAVPPLQVGLVTDRKADREAYAKTVADQHESGTFTDFVEEEEDSQFDPCGEVEAMPDFSRERGVETKCYSYLADERFNAQMRVIYQKDAGGRIDGVRAVGFGGNF